MPIEKVSFEDSLGKHVLPDKCIGCAACVIVCPLNCLELVDGEPRIVKPCQICGICARVCPKLYAPMTELEKFVFGRERDKEERFGIHRRVIIARANDEKVLKFCQDGGVVTSLLAFALNSRMIDGAIVSGLSEKEPLKPVPRFVTNAEELLACAGTRYTYSPNLLALKEAVLQKRRMVAFVGVPEQIGAIRNIQMVPLKKYAVTALNVGLFCSESFTYGGFVKECIQERLGISPADVTKVNIKGKIIVETKSGDVKTFPLKEAKKYTSRGCSSCRDFSAELADISVGGLGLNGWTLTVLRTDAGEKIFQKAEDEGVIRTRPIDAEKQALDLLLSISDRKRMIKQ